MRILITSGPTREHIDQIRFISNISTGKTGAFLADYFLERNHEVVYVHGASTELPNTKCRTEAFTSFEDLKVLLKDLLSTLEFDVVFHTAAVSDFSVDTVQTKKGWVSPFLAGKLSSEDNLEIRFKRNPKIIDDLKAWSKNAKVIVVGFKLTTSGSLEEQLLMAKEVQTRSNADFVIQNNYNEIRGNIHPTRIVSREGVINFQTKQDIATYFGSVLEGQP